MLRYLIILCIYTSACSNTKSQVETQKTPQRYLALGDSYTIGESVEPSMRWPVQLADSLRARGMDIAQEKIIATTGWRTDDLAMAMQEAELIASYDIVSLLIGVNNQYQGKSVEEYKPEFKALLTSAIQLARGKKENVFVVSIPDYAYTGFGQTRDAAKISRELEIYNRACKEITLAMDVQHIDITDISKRGLEDVALVAEDGLHPSGKQYTKWVEEILLERYD